MEVKTFSPTVIDLHINGDDNEIELDKWETNAAAEVGDKILEDGYDLSVFAIRNHGIDIGKVKSLIECGNCFFALPEERRTIHSRSATERHGYVARVPEDMTETTFETHLGYSIADMNGKFPEEIPEMKNLAEGLVKSFKFATKAVLRALDMKLGYSRRLSDNHSFKLNNKTFTSMKIMHYPKVPITVPKGSVRLPEHADFTTLSFVYCCEGFQVKDRSGQWLDVTKEPDDVLMLFGDVMSFMTGNRIPAEKHRVVVCKDDDYNLVRTSLIFFAAPDMGVKIKALDDSIQSDPVDIESIIMVPNAYYSIKE